MRFVALKIRKVRLKHRRRKAGQISVEITETIAHVEIDPVQESALRTPDAEDRKIAPASPATAEEKDNPVATETPKKAKAKAKAKPRAAKAKTTPSAKAAAKKAPKKKPEGDA